MQLADLQSTQSTQSTHQNASNLQLCLDADISKSIVGGNPIQVKADSKPET